MDGATGHSLVRELEWPVATAGETDLLQRLARSSYVSPVFLLLD